MCLCTPSALCDLVVLSTAGIMNCTAALPACQCLLLGSVGSRTPDGLICVLHLKGGLPCQQLKGENADGPHIHTAAIAASPGCTLAPGAVLRQRHGQHLQQPTPTNVQAYLCAPAGAWPAPEPASPRRSAQVRHTVNKEPGLDALQTCAVLPSGAKVRWRSSLLC